MLREKTVSKGSFLPCILPRAYEGVGIPVVDSMAGYGRWSSLVLVSDMAASGHTLPEHHSALALLQLMDHTWFQDNLLKPRVGLIDAFLPLPSSHLRSPYQSIELTDAALSEWTTSCSSQLPRSGSMPRARFETRSSSLELCNAPDSGYVLAVFDHWLRQNPPCAHGIIFQQHVSPRFPTDTVRAPSAALQAWFANDLRNRKAFEEIENLQVEKFKSVDYGKQPRVSLMDGQLPQPSLRLLGTKRAQRKNSKSMTACEFNELQGFMDLGFHFSQEDMTPRIVKMFPVLQRKLEEAGSSQKRLEIVRQKPIQSSGTTWLVRQSSTPLRQWQIPATREDMKEHLKFWARAVASTVRQEC